MNESDIDAVVSLLDGKIDMDNVMRVDTDHRGLADVAHYSFKEDGIEEKTFKTNKPGVEKNPKIRPLPEDRHDIIITKFITNIAKTELLCKDYNDGLTNLKREYYYNYDTDMHHVELFTRGQVCGAGAILEKIYKDRDEKFVSLVFSNGHHHKKGNTLIISKGIISQEDYVQCLPNIAKLLPLEKIANKQQSFSKLKW